MLASGRTAIDSFGGVDPVRWIVAGSDVAAVVDLAVPTRME
jgi:hypothetical protein